MKDTPEPNLYLHGRWILYIGHTLQAPFDLFEAWDCIVCGSRLVPTSGVVTGSPVCPGATTQLAPRSLN